MVAILRHFCFFDKIKDSNLRALSARKKDIYLHLFNTEGTIGEVTAISIVEVLSLHCGTDLGPAKHSGAKHIDPQYNLSYHIRRQRLLAVGKVTGRVGPVYSDTAERSVWKNARSFFAD